MNVHGFQQFDLETRKSLCFKSSGDSMGWILNMLVKMSQYVAFNIKFEQLT